MLTPRHRSPFAVPLPPVVLAVALAGCGGAIDPAEALGLPAALRQPERSLHFVVHTDYRGVERDRQLRLLDGMFDWFSANWLLLPPQPEPLRVLLFADAELARSWSDSLDLADASGRLVQYRLPGDTADRDLLVVDSETGLGTSFHELVHYCLKLTCPRPRTVFVEEGIAAFFEKFLGWMDGDGALHLTVGYLHPGRFLRIHSRHADVDIVRQWTAERADFDCDAARSFMLFLHRKGWLLPFVRALPTAGGDGRAELERIAGRSLRELDTGWHAWVEAQPYVLGGDATLVERATILDAAGWQRWIADNAARLRFDDQLGIWRVR